MDPVVVRQLVRRIFDLMADKLGARGGDLEARFGQVKRRLPRRVRLAVVQLIKADKLSKSPQLAMQIDPGKTSAAYARALEYLDGVDVSERKSKARYGFAATIAGQLLLVLIAFIAVMYWRGFI